MEATADRKLSIIKRIFEVTEQGVLDKIEALLPQKEIIGFEIDGTPITQEAFIAEMQEMDEQIKNDTFETFSTEQVRQYVLGK